MSERWVSRIRPGRMMSPGGTARSVTLNQSRGVRFAAATVIGPDAATSPQPCW